MSIRQIAKALGVSHTLLVLWRQGKRRLDPELEARCNRLVTSEMVTNGYGTDLGKQRTTALVGDRGLEPRTPVLSGLCSDRLS